VRRGDKRELRSALKLALTCSVLFYLKGRRVGRGYPEQCMDLAAEKSNEHAVTWVRRGKEATLVRRLNHLATLLLAVLALGCAAFGVLLWPDTSGPPPGEPTLTGFNFVIDQPDVAAAVRLLINPDAKFYTNREPGLLLISVSLDVSPGATVHWALMLGGVSSRISMRLMPEGSRGLNLTYRRASEPYDLGYPIGTVADYVITGEVQGPSTAYSTLASQNFPEVNPRQSAIASLAWAGPLPAVFKGAYVTVTMPSLTMLPAQGPSSVFDGAEFAPSKHEVEEELAVGWDYQISAGSGKPTGLASWIWSSESGEGIANANAIGSSVDKQSDVQRRSFFAGLLFGLAGTAVVSALPFATAALTEGRMRRTHDPCPSRPPA